MIYAKNSRKLCRYLHSSQICKFPVKSLAQKSALYGGFSQTFKFWKNIGGIAVIKTPLSNQPLPM